MNNSKIISLLKELSSKETEKFSMYVSSPIINKQEKLKQLCDYLLQYAPDFAHEALKKQTVYKYVYSKNKLELSKLNNLTSDLLQLLYQFLAWQEYNNAEAIQKNFMLQGLLKKGNTSHAEQQLRKWKNNIGRTSIRNDKYYQAQYFLNDKQDSLFLRQKKREQDIHLDKKSKNLDLYYLCSKLKIACDMANRNITMQTAYDVSFVDDYIKLIPGYILLENHPSILIYHKILIMMTQNQESHYQDVKKLLEKNLQLLPQEELSNLYGYLLNFCVKQINYGKGAYYQEIFKLYQLLLKQKIILERDTLSEKNFMNIVTVGLRMHDFEWTENFINHYKNHLHPEIRENAYRYNMASFYYANKDYKAALQLLHNVEFTDSFYHIGAKIIQLKSFYELNETEPFFSLLEALKKYIQRNRQLSAYHKTSNLLFLKLAKKLQQLKNNKQLVGKSIWKKKQQILADKIRTSANLANKEWLIERIEKISGTNAL